MCFNVLGAVIVGAPFGCLWADHRNLFIKINIKQFEVMLGTGDILAVWGCKNIFDENSSGYIDCYKII